MGGMWWGTFCQCWVRSCSTEHLLAASTCSKGWCGEVWGSVARCGPMGSRMVGGLWHPCVDCGFGLVIH